MSTGVDLQRLKLAREHGRSVDWDLRELLAGGDADPLELVSLVEHLEPCADVAGWDGPGDEPLRARVSAWREAFATRVPPPLLSMTERDDGTAIIDTRTVAPALRVTLRGIEHRVHRACRDAPKPDALSAALAADGGGPVAEPEARDALRSLVARRLVVRLGTRHLALALRGDVPSLPRRSGSGRPIAPRSERRTIEIDEPLELQSGARLERYTLGFETRGTLSPARDNAVLVCHSLTKDAHAAGPGGWWDAVIGPGRMLDTDRRHVICVDALGSGASTSPASTDPRTGRPYGLRLPVLTVSDMVDAARALLQRLGIDRLQAVIGGCLGGQHALAWAIRHPEAVRCAVVIGTTPATSAHTIAIFGVMRRLIRADPAFAGGDYYGGPFPATGRGNALAAAMPLWMSREAAEARFGRRRVDPGSERFTLDAEFAIERFLERVATQPPGRLDPNSLIYLTRAVDYFDLEHEYGSLERALASVTARVLLVSYRSDWRYPPAEVARLHDALVAAGCDSTHDVLDSPYGHGAFLYDTGGLGPVVARFLDATSRTTTG